ncbi:MAG: DUF309 domain-containing protein [Chloroflexota bacterium]
MTQTRDCEGRLHPQAEEGLRLFAEGQYFEAHEALELAWREETGAVRDLYRGILQAAVVYLHVKRGNYAGAVKVYGRCMKWLNQWPETCRGVDVEGLRQDLNKVMNEVKRLGPQRLSEFDLSLLKSVKWETKLRAITARE